MSDVASNGRLLPAILISSFCVAVPFILFAVFSGQLGNSRITFFIPMAPIVAFVGVTVVGIPVHSFLLWRRMSRPIHYAVPGFVAPALYVILMQPLGAGDTLAIGNQALLFGSFGAGVALVFRWVALGKPRTKDRARFSHD